MAAPAAPDLPPSHVSIDDRNTGVLAGLVLFAVALGALAVLAGWGRDFASFYHSAAALAGGSDPYRGHTADAAVNINLPHATGLLIPLSALSYPVAFAVWQSIQVIAWALLLRRLMHAQPSLSTVEFAAAAVLFPGTLAQLAQGQWGFLLAWLLVMAWYELRRSRDAASGVWVGVATAVKPFVGLLILAELFRGRVRLAMVAAGTAATFFVAGALLLGLTPYLQWFDAVGRLEWAGYPSNASVRGLFERSLPAEAAHWWPLGAIAVAAGSLAAAARCEDDALSWSLVLVGALLSAPVGWLYYGWILAPSVLALREWSRPAKFALLLLWVPPGLMPGLSTAGAGLLLLWCALLIVRLRSPRRPGTPLNSASGAA